MTQRFIPPGSSGQPEADGQPVVLGLTTIWSEHIEEARPTATALAQHVVRQAIENLRRSPITALLTLLTISTALFLLGVFGIFSQNLARSKGFGAQDVKVHVFLRDGVSDASRDGLVQELGQVSHGAKISYLSQEGALRDFREMLGDDAVILEGIDTDNPLPASLTLVFDSWSVAEPAFAEIEQRFSSDSRVDTIRFTRKIAAQLGRIISLLRIMGYVGIAFLVVVAGFITSNTISLALFGHRMEIEIMRLVGAKRRAIYAPYILEGFLQGGCGAIVATSVLSLMFFSLKEKVESAEPLRMILPSLSFLSLPFLGFVVVTGILIGTVSSFFAVRRFLRAG